MPEMPELEVVRHRLGPQLVGRRISEVVVSARLGFLLRTTVDQVRSLQGQTISDVRRRGKFLIIVMESAHLVINPMLGGRFLWSAPGEKVGAITVLRIALEGGQELRYTDSARMGRVYIAERGALSTVHGWDELGPEAIDVSLAEWQQRIRRHPGELKNLLRNQAFVAGIGNAYSDEILHRAGLLPLRRRSTLEPPDIERLHTATQAVLAEAVAAIEAQPDYVSHKQDRSFMAVHMKGGQDCPRCGHRISELTARGEVTNFCRGCQS